MSESELYIIVTNWRRFQYYKNRNPPWIKNLTQLLHDDNYLSLPPGTRALLHGLWLEYASSNARLRLDTRSLSARLRLRVTKQQLDWLKHKGFIEYAQTPRIQHVVTSRAREEAETEKNKSLPAKEASYDARDGFDIESLGELIGRQAGFPQAGDQDQERDEEKDPWS